MLGFWWDVIAGNDLPRLSNMGEESPSRSTIFCLLYLTGPTTCLEFLRHVIR
jgi:hypothetical protein